uniref:Putative secreted protein n=1 Tax=Anopheles marajoara TaxID=58244 RepID=A0A2M4CBZ1_9DIPT
MLLAAREESLTYLLLLLLLASRCSSMARALSREYPRHGMRFRTSEERRARRIYSIAPSTQHLVVFYLSFVSRCWARER